MSIKPIAVLQLAESRVHLDEHDHPTLYEIGILSRALLAQADFLHNLRIKLALVGLASVDQVDLDEINQLLGCWRLAADRVDAIAAEVKHAHASDLPELKTCGDCGNLLNYSARNLGTGLCHLCAHKRFAKKGD